MPDGGRNHAAGIGYNGKVYVFGGRDGGNKPGQGKKDSYVYDPNNNKWNKLKDMPMGMGGNGQAVEIGGKLLVIGGETCCGTIDEVLAYDPDNDSWEYLKDMKTSVHGMAPVRVGNNIYVAAGGTKSGFSQSNKHQVLKFNN